MAIDSSTNLAEPDLNDRPLISVVIPIYKVEEYLARCIDSVLSQTYSNTEIILVNDGSPDNCDLICAEYKEKDNRIIVITKENGGLSEARNIGIDTSSGDYITFIDSDDWVHSTYLEILYETLVKTESDISVCNFKKTSQYYVRENLSEMTTYEYTNTEALGQFLGEYYTQMVVAWAKLYKIELFENIRFPKGKLLEDEYTTYKLIYKSLKTAFSTAQLYYYFQRDDSITGIGYSVQKRLAQLESYEQRADFFSSIGLQELASKTYRLVFLRGFYIEKQLAETEEGSEIDKFNHKFMNLKKKLRKGKYKLRFKLFFEVYYLVPKITSWIYKASRGGDF